MSFDFTSSFRQSFIVPKLARLLLGGSFFPSFLFLSRSLLRFLAPLIASPLSLSHCAVLYTLQIAQLSGKLSMEFGLATFPLSFTRAHRELPFREFNFSLERNWRRPLLLFTFVTSFPTERCGLVAANDL